MSTTGPVNPLAAGRPPGRRPGEPPGPAELRRAGGSLAVLTREAVRAPFTVRTIAYFCAAELLANAAKHSYANKVVIEVAGRGRTLMLRVSDDGRGGADRARGSGLSGLVQRVRTVDGDLEIASPPGGPTQVTVQLPLRA